MNREIHIYIYTYVNCKALEWACKYLYTYLYLRAHYIATV